MIENNRSIVTTVKNGEGEEISSTYYLTDNDSVDISSVLNSNSQNTINISISNQNNELSYYGNLSKLLKEANIDNYENILKIRINSIHTVLELNHDQMLDIRGSWTLDTNSNVLICTNVQDLSEIIAED